VLRASVTWSSARASVSKMQVIRSHKGLGDTVEFLLQKTGIAYAVKMAASSVGITDCGCEKRKEILNEHPISKALYKNK
jgi:hypothetical protein